MHTKKNGFMLMEALAAIAIIGMVLTPVFVLQNNIVRRVFTLSKQMHQVIFVENFFVKTHKIIENNEEDVREFTLEKLYNDPDTVLQYELKAVDKDSSLGSVPGLLAERVWISSKDRTLPTDSLVSFMFKPESEKK